MKLTDEQLNIIKHVEQGYNVYVDAVIGSGKTTLLNAIVKNEPHKRILYLTYNRLLKEDAKNKIKSTNAEVQNYHGFAYINLVKSGYSYTHQSGIQDLIKLVNENKIFMPQYDLILVDEYQDINNVTKDLLLLIDKYQAKPPQIVFVGDMNQKIYDTTTIDVLEDCVFKLRDNYIKLDLTRCFRLNESHAAMISKIWDKEIIGVNSNLETRNIPYYPAAILDILNKYNNKDILILTPFRNNKQLTDLINYIEKVNPEKYNKTNLYVTIKDREEMTSPVENSMIVTTFDGSKGLERELVIVFGFNENTLNWRSERSNAKIIKNLYLVAASRGKREILFVEDDRSEILDEYNFNSNLRKHIPASSFNASQMFDFVYDTDLEATYNLLEIEEMEQSNTTEVKVLHADYNIQLSPIVGTYQEAVFFNSWEFEKALSIHDKTKPIYKYIQKVNPKNTLQQVLAITALETNLIRYVTQATPEIIDKENNELLLNRLSTHLEPNSKTQVYKQNTYRDITIKGIIDAVHKDVPYELKFVNELEKKHFLQIATYLILGDFSEGILWNTRFNKMFKVKIKDRDKFIDNMLRTITKGVRV